MTGCLHFHMYVCIQPYLYMNIMFEHENVMTEDNQLQITDYRPLVICGW